MPPAYALSPAGITRIVLGVVVRRPNGNLQNAVDDMLDNGRPNVVVESVCVQAVELMVHLYPNVVQVCVAERSAARVVVVRDGLYAPP